MLVADWLIEFPAWSEVSRIVSMRDYNTRVVVAGVAVLGAGSGLVGSFALLRKRALIGDALAHAALPGIASAFLIATALGGDAKSLGWLLLGACISGVLGVIAILWLRSQTRLSEDAAMGIVLSVFFGGGVALLGIVQQMGSGAGLEGFIYGKTASMRAEDVSLILIASLIALCIGLLQFKQLKLLCFDELFASSRGFNTTWLDGLLMAMIILVTIVGLQAVGIILMIALLIIPAASARFWTESFVVMTAISAMIGAIGGVVGAMLSGIFAGLPSGAMIVLVCSGLFFVSMLFGRSRGVVIRFVRRRNLNHKIEGQHLLRAAYEWIEDHTNTRELDGGPQRKPIPTCDLLPMRSWSLRTLSRAIDEASSEELVRRTQEGNEIRLTGKGWVEACRLTRQHRLWEMYLIEHADIAPAKVDRDADAIEHVLAPEVIERLEDLLDQQGLSINIPMNPHVKASLGGGVR
ncbi:MAG: iron chelate uptake ABC transporter family permease subunit [Planctomycetota bacterium]